MHMYVYVYVLSVCIFKAFYSPLLLFKLLLRFDFELRLNVCNTFTSIDSQLERTVLMNLYGQTSARFDWQCACNG